MTHDEHKIILDSLLYVVADIASIHNSPEQRQLVKDCLSTIKWYCEENNLTQPSGYHRWTKWLDQQEKR